MDLDKTVKLLAGVESCLNVLVAASDLRSRTGAFRNAMTASDFDAIMGATIATLRGLNNELLSKDSDDD